MARRSNHRPSHNNKLTLHLATGRSSSQIREHNPPPTPPVHPPPYRILPLSPSKPRLQILRTRQQTTPASRGPTPNPLLNNRLPHRPSPNRISPPRPLSRLDPSQILPAGINPLQKRNHSSPHHHLCSVSTRSPTTRQRRQRRQPAQRIGL